MVETVPEFSVSAMKRLIQRVSKFRVSREAALELSAVLEEHGLRISSEALKLAQHRGAKTVNERDIRTAAGGIHR